MSSEEVKVENEQEALDYENEIKRIQERIEKKEKMLEKLKSDNTNIVELENLIEIWKNGCRNAYLHLTKLLNDRQGDDFNCKTWLKSVGIWNVMTKYFQNDYEISFSNDSE